MTKIDIKLQESSLSRVWQHFNDKDTTVVIFTAFRDGIKYEDNISKNKKFAATLKKNNKFGYFFVEGFFPENEGTEDEVQVREDSIFAIASANRSQDLVNLCHDFLANSTNQDSIIVKDAQVDKVYFLDSGKNKTYLTNSQLKPGALGKYYTKLRNKKKTNTFVFENIKDGKGYLRSFKEYVLHNK